MYSGVFVKEASEAVFENNVFKMDRGTSNKVRGIFLKYIENTTFKNNSIYKHAYGNIVGTYSSNLTFEYNLINDSTNEDGVDLQYGFGHNIFYKNTFKGNRGSQGSIYLHQGAGTYQCMQVLNKKYSKEM